MAPGRSWLPRLRGLNGGADNDGHARSGSFLSRAHGLTTERRAAWAQGAAVSVTLRTLLPWRRLTRPPHSLSQGWALDPLVTL